MLERPVCRWLAGRWQVGLLRQVPLVTAGVLDRVMGDGGLVDGGRVDDVDGSLVEVAEMGLAVDLDANAVAVGPGAVLGALLAAPHHNALDPDVLAALGGGPDTAAPGRGGRVLAGLGEIDLGEACGKYHLGLGDGVWGRVGDRAAVSAVASGVVLDVIAIVTPLSS